MNAASSRQRQTADKTKPAASDKDDSAQAQRPSVAANTNGPDPALVSAAQVNLQPVNNVPANPPPISALAEIPAVAVDSTSQAISTVGGPNQLKLDSEMKVSADQDNLVFDATLRSAAPVPARPPQTALAGAGKPAWLLNAQPVYGAREDSSKVANSSQLPAPNTDDTTQTTSAAPGPQQIALQNIAASIGQAADKAAVSNAQTKPDADPAKTNNVQPISTQASRQTNMEQSSSDNSPGFEKDPKQPAAEPGVSHQPEPAMQASQVPHASAADATKLDPAAPSNPAAPVSSKSAALPINQQTEIPQPSMKSDLNMRIQGQSGENINVRISERAGDIQISVRSSDQGTANILKHELPSIEAGLERAGWRMESSGMSQSGQDQQQAGRDSQEPDRNRDQNSQQQPNWQDRNQRRRDSSPNPWFEMDQ